MNKTTNLQDKIAAYLSARRHLNSNRKSSPEEAERACTAFIAAEADVIKEPATTLEDLRDKFDVVWIDPAALPTNKDILNVFADFRRLTGRPSKLFDAELWLSRFEQRGGLYCTRGEEVFLLQPKGTDLDDDMFELEALGGREAVEELIRSRQGVAEPRSDAERFHSLVARLEAVEASEECSEASINEAGDLTRRIMAMPAPDAAAVRWKLDYILDTTGGSNAPYAADFLEQLFADYRRFLGEG